MCPLARGHIRSMFTDRTPLNSPMSLALRISRIFGVAVALWLFWHLSSYLFSWQHNYGVDTYFLRQVVLPTIPYLALLLLLLLPFSRIRRSSVWLCLFVAVVLLSLWWFIPAAYQPIAHPTIHVEKPPGTPEGVVPNRVIIKHSYERLRLTGVLSAFLLTQILAIWYARKPISNSTNVA
jgi:ABC-type proline/glycine betaine transport system permease subunit